MTEGSRSSPASAIAGSPGNSCCKPKISTDTKNNVGTISAIRRSRKVVMRYRESLHLDPLRADEAVGVRGEPRQFRGHPVKIFVMPQIGERPVGEQAFGKLGIMRQALGRVRGLARRVELAVDIRVTVMPGVDRRRRLAGDEIVDVAIRVGAAAPADQVGLEIALRGKIQ